MHRGLSGAIIHHSTKLGMIVEDGHLAAVRDIKEVKANEKNCMPLFVVLRSGHIAGRVVGLNAPGLRDFLDLSMPELPGEGDAA